MPGRSTRRRNRRAVREISLELEDAAIVSTSTNQVPSNQDEVVDENEIQTEGSGRTEIEDSISFTKSQRGASLLHYKGYSYSRSYSRSERNYWKCSHRAICSSTIITDLANSAVIKFNEHNHIPNPTSLRVKKVMDAIKESAKCINNQPIFQPIDIIANVIQNQPDCKFLEKYI